MDKKIDTACTKSTFQAAGKEAAIVPPDGRGFFAVFFTVADADPFLNNVPFYWHDKRDLTTSRK